ncbi:hypothetical protein Tco_0501991 [Tanacetum coccineum]
MDVCSRISAAGDFMLSAAGSASKGSAKDCKTATKVKFSVSIFNGVDNCVAIRHNVCASGLKHVTVVVAVPSSIIALKQYLFVTNGIVEGIGNVRQILGVVVPGNLRVGAIGEPQWWLRFRVCSKQAGCYRVVFVLPMLGWGL